MAENQALTEAQIQQAITEQSNTSFLSNHLPATYDEASNFYRALKNAANSEKTLASLQQLRVFEAGLNTSLLNIVNHYGADAPMPEGEPSASAETCYLARLMNTEIAMASDWIVENGEKPVQTANGTITVNEEIKNSLDHTNTSMAEMVKPIQNVYAQYQEMQRQAEQQNNAEAQDPDAEQDENAVPEGAFKLIPTQHPTIFQVETDQSGTFKRTHVERHQIVHTNPNGSIVKALIIGKGPKGKTATIKVTGDTNFEHGTTHLSEGKNCIEITPEADAVKSKRRTSFGMASLAPVAMGAIVGGGALYLGVAAPTALTLGIAAAANSVASKYLPAVLQPVAKASWAFGVALAFGATAVPTAATIGVAVGAYSALNLMMPNSSIPTFAAIGIGLFYVANTMDAQEAMELGGTAWQHIQDYISGAIDSSQQVFEGSQDTVTTNGAAVDCDKIQSPEMGSSPEEFRQYIQQRNNMGCSLNPLKP